MTNEQGLYHFWFGVYLLFANITWLFCTLEYKPCFEAQLISLLIINMLMVCYSLIMLNLGSLRVYFKRKKRFSMKIEQEKERLAYLKGQLKIMHEILEHKDILPERFIKIDPEEKAI